MARTDPHFFPHRLVEVDDHVDAFSRSPQEYFQSPNHDASCSMMTVLRPVNSLPVNDPFARTPPATPRELLGSFRSKKQSEFLIYPIIVLCIIGIHILYVYIIIYIYKYICIYIYNVQYIFI